MPGTGDDKYGTGGGKGSTFPWANNRGDNNFGEQGGAPAYNGTGGGGGGAPDAGLIGGDGANGVVGFAIYDPNDIFDVSYVAPPRRNPDVNEQVTTALWQGYRIWYFHGTNTNGTFTINGRKQR